MAEEADPSPPIGGRPESAAIGAFLLGGVVGATPLGVFAMSAEQMGDASPGDVAQRVFLVAMLVQAAAWALLLRAAIAVRRPWAIALLVAGCLVTSVIAAGGIILSGVEHPPPSLFPLVGCVFAVVSIPALLVSFTPVLALARRVPEGRPGQSTLDVSAAGFAWTAAVSALGLSLAPGIVFAAISTLSLALALLVLRRVHALALGMDGEPGRALSLLRRGLRTGGPGVLLLGLVLLPLRLHERSTTRNPAIRAIYKHGLGGHCEVRPAGREGEISLWRVDCGSNTGPVVGWDEREGTLLEGEKLRTRVPGVPR